MTDDSWYVVRNTPGVTGFLGSSGGGTKPTPLLPEEVDSLCLNKWVWMNAEWRIRLCCWRIG